MATRAVLAGASGLIGSALLDILLQQPEYNEVILLVRTELPVANKKLTQLKIDFDQLNNYASFITGHTIFSCLGSTRKKTPNLTDYRKIDHDYPLKLAELAKKKWRNTISPGIINGREYKIGKFLYQNERGDGRRY